MGTLSWLVHREDGLFRIRRGREDLLASDVAGFAIVPLSDPWRAPHIALLRYDGELSRVSVLLEGRGRERMLYETANLLTSLAWHPSGSMCVFVQSDDDGCGSLLAASLKPGALAQIVLQPRHAYAQPAWSDDGSWFAIEGQPIDELRGMTIFGGPAGGPLGVIDPVEAPLPKCTSPWFAPGSSIQAPR